MSLNEPRYHSCTVHVLTYNIHNRIPPVLSNTFNSNSRQTGVDRGRDGVTLLYVNDLRVHGRDLRAR
jgi:hypothetical protein